MIRLPIFPDGTEYGDVDGVLVSREPGHGCTAWSNVGPRSYPAPEFRRARLLTEAQFRRWAEGVCLSPSAEGCRCRNRAASTPSACSSAEAPALYVAR